MTGREAHGESMETSHFRLGRRWVNFFDRASLYPYPVRPVLGKTFSPLPSVINRYYGANHIGVLEQAVGGREGKDPHEYRFSDSG